MDNKLIVLKLMLDELGVDSKISSQDDRKTIQKAVYLAQRKAADLGYRFGWYKMGPYSSSLTRDYYNLADAITSGDKGYSNRRLHPTVQQKLTELRPLLIKPIDLKELTSDQWIELVASYHFLREVSRQGDAEATETLQREKPLLAPYVEYAKESLRKVGLGD